MKISPKDQEDRIRAATTFDRNVVVTAGAGTGKTTLLIHRLLHLLMRGQDATPITAIVALTFTNKSANEMKIRLREALETLISDEGSSGLVLDLMKTYGLSKSNLDTRATAAIQGLERSEIGTIHHFATSLLRLYPIEAGVDPQFAIDESGDFSRKLFEVSWRAWLEAELVINGARQDLWQNVLEDCSLKEIEALAQCFISEPLYFSKLLEKKQGEKVPRLILEWLKSLEEKAASLLEDHPEGRKIEVLLAAAKTWFQTLGTEGGDEIDFSQTDSDLLLNGKASKVKGWERAEFKTAEHLIKIAKQMLQVDEDFMYHLRHLLAPFVRLFHEKARQEAWISFDSLLVKARDLLHGHPAIRETLKQRYEAILIDEFQDTDPVQYEILLYLAEEAGQNAKNWQTIKLSPGKLFVVGDPKQSIYGFRRADIEAYHAVRDLIFEQGGMHCKLRTNFRSHGLILDVVNDVFECVMTEKAGIQPEYIPIHPPESETQVELEAKIDTGDLKFRKVSLRLLQNTSEKWTAETAKQTEGEAIARWLSDEVLGKAVIAEAEGKTRVVEKRDVAILMRKLTGVRHILEPLRRAGIVYWVEGEKHFYQQQEVIDAVNLLRTVADSNDKIALVGVLRSPVGGLDDETIYELEQKGLLNYRCEPESLDAHICELYMMFSRLHEVSGVLPIAEAVSTIFDESPIRLLVARVNDGVQALANLKKIEAEAAALSKEETLTFRAVVACLQAAVTDGTEAAESPLAEAGVDAVKVFSIHKAKGLEFPVVILAGCQSGPTPRETKVASLHHDWSSALTGLRLGDMRDLNAIFLKEKIRIREIEEGKRLLYVAMTRAREHLMISAAPNENIQSNSFLSHFQSALGEDAFDRLMSSDAETVSMGAGSISVSILSEIKQHAVSPVIENDPAFQIDFSAMKAQWKKQFEVYETIQKKRIFISPSQLKNTDKTTFKKNPVKEKSTALHSSSDISRWLGQLSHRFLEGWDFSSDLKNYKEKLVSFLNQQKLIDEGITQTALFEEMNAIFRVFFFSPAYAALTQVKIVGREVPFLMPWQGQVMQGEIDLIYEEAGKLYIADYKTDRIKKTEIQDTAKQYHHQCQIYPEAVRRALQREVAGMKLIFLRLGLSYSVSMGA